jgi:drug/metabolite transporter (DMT)-like permease
MPVFADRRVQRGPGGRAVPPWLRGVFVSVTIVGAVLFAAVLHAAWNAVAHAIPDRVVGFVLISAVCAVLAVPLVLLSPLPAGPSWPLLICSAAVHVLYVVLLMSSYRLGDFGQVYPLSRGSAPLLVALIAALVVGERPGAVQLAGIATVSAGLLCLVSAGGRPGRAELPAIGAALLTGVTIAAYTAIDGIAVRQAHTATGYAGWLFLLQGPVIPLVARLRRGPALLEQVRPHRVAGLGGGALSLAAYGLVLWAQTRGALAPIAALRESSVVVAAVVGALAFGEPFGRRRVVASVLVAGGIVLLAS